MPEPPSPELPSTVVQATPSAQPPQSDATQKPPVNPDLLNQLRVDQRFRWEQGVRIPVEEYLEAYPALKTDPASVLELIYQEVLLRRQRQEQPSVEYFVQR